MNVLIAAGGTGGHIYPGIAIANEIVSRDASSQVLFVGTARGLEKKIVTENGYELVLINSVGLKNVGLSGKIKGLAVLPKSFLEARVVLRDFRPDVVVGAGGYVSGPVLMMAHLMRFPTLIMDSNALPGFTNRRLARFVDKAALSFDAAARYFGSKAVVTGNPVRSEFFDVPARPIDGPKHLLVFGGSQGARAINNAMIQALPALASIKDSLSITHQTGAADLDDVTNGYREMGWTDVEVRPYISNIVDSFELADLILCRSGATSCAEVAASGRATVMVPLPGAADDHQRKNAEAMVNGGAAKMILQSALTGDVLASVLSSVLGDPNMLAEMGAAARRMARPDAAKATVDLLEEMIS